MFTSVGETLLNAFNPEVVLAALRGSFEAIKIIVESISENLGLVFDPKKADGLEVAFRNSRDLVVSISESLVMAGVKLFDWVKQSAGMFSSVMDQAQLLALQAKKATFVATDPIFGGEDRTMLTRAFNLASEKDIANMNNDIMRLQARIGHQQAANVKPKDTDTTEITKNFEKVRAKMREDDAKKDAERRAIMAQAVLNDAAKVLEKNARNAAAALEAAAKAEKKRIEDLEMLNRDVGRKAADLLRENATAAEEFNRKLTDSIAIFRQAAGVDPNLLGKLGKGLTRKVGKDLEQLIKDFGVAPDQNLPGAMTRGSSAAVEQEIRASMQLTTQDFETQLIAAAKNQERQSQLQVERLDKLVIAAEKAGIFAAAQLAEQKRAADAAKEAAAGKNKPVAVLPK